MGKEKLLPAHKRAIELLEEDPIRHFDTLAAMYQHTMVFSKEASELSIAFTKAKDRIEKEDNETIGKVHSVLQKQTIELWRERANRGIRIWRGINKRDILYRNKNNKFASFYFFLALCRGKQFFSRLIFLFFKTWLFVHMDIFSSFISNDIAIARLLLILF